MREQNEQHEKARHPQDQYAERVQALLERRWRTVRLERSSDAAEPRVCPGRDHEHGRLAAHHGRSAEQGVVGFRGIFGAARARPLLHRVRLAGQQRLVRMRRMAREHDPVGGDEIAGRKLDDISRHDVLDGNARNRAVAPHRSAHGH